MSSNRNSALPVALGAAVAGLVGAGLGMLFAPKKGKDLRKDLTKAAIDTEKTVKESVLGFGEQVRDTYEEARRGLIGDYRQLREELDKSVEQLVTKGELTKLRFDESVDKVVTRAARAKRWSKDEAEKYAAQLKREYEGA